MLRTGIAALSFVVIMTMRAQMAWAQYEFDPSAAHEMDNPGPRIFGSVKDERGVLIEGATIVLDSDRFSLLLVTDAVGRFKTNVPLGTDPALITATCAKPGYKMQRLSRRPGPAGVKPTLQLDCVLRSSAVK
jgi:hypothetical protein